MKQLEVKFKKLVDGAKEPSYAHNTDAGMDLYATSRKVDEYGNTVYGTGIAVEIPKGYAAFIFPRSSNSKKALLLANSVGIIDSGYTGEIVLKYRSTTCGIRLCKLIDRIRFFLFGTFDSDRLLVSYFHDINREYKIGDRIGQMVIMPYPRVMLIQVPELGNSERGSNGFGSTGE